MTSAQFSRPTSNLLGGKQTNVVKTLVSDSFKEDLTRFWRDKGYESESDFVREALLVTVYGPEFMADLHRQRILSLVRNVSDVGTDSARTVPEASR